MLKLISLKEIHRMIKVEEALDLVKINSHSLPSENIDLKNSLGRALSEEVSSPINMPPFRQSAMDGYAVNSNTENEYRLIGEVAAGSSQTYCLKEGEAIRIFTGAMVPDSADLVIAQENITRVEDRITSTVISKMGQHIRPLGEQIKEGEVALKKGTTINPAGIGFLASIGVTEVNVHMQPKITIVVTGNELVVPGEKLLPGQIYESNSIMLKSIIEKHGFTEINIITIKDDYVSTKSSLMKAFEQSDLVIVTGGISVGDYDFVGKALTEIGCETIFYKVKQKPGKPIFFGKQKDRTVFALPGNPAAALTSFYIYVLPHLNALAGKSFEGLRQSNEIITEDYVKKGDRGQFLKALTINGKVKILDGQASSMLHTFASANALIYIPSEVTSLKKGDSVLVYHFD